MCNKVVYLSERVFAAILHSDIRFLYEANVDVTPANRIIVIIISFDVLLDKCNIIGDPKKFAAKLPGPDKAKKDVAAKRQSGSGSGSASKIDLLSAQIEAFNRVNEEKLKLKNEKLKIEEAKVLAIDTSSIPEARRRVIEKLQEDIISKYS